jgi:hypothetical protein
MVLHIAKFEAAKKAITVAVVCLNNATANANSALNIMEAINDAGCDRDILADAIKKNAIAVAYLNDTKRAFYVAIGYLNDAEKNMKLEVAKTEHAQKMSALADPNFESFVMAYDEAKERERSY